MGIHQDSASGTPYAVEARARCRTVISMMVYSCTVPASYADSARVLCTLYVVSCAVYWYTGGSLVQFVYPMLHFTYVGYVERVQCTLYIANTRRYIPFLYSVRKDAFESLIPFETLIL